MEIVLHPKAVEELEDLPEDVKKEVKSRLRELEEIPTGHENSDSINIDGRTVFKFVMKKDGRGGRIDHRAVYDIQNGEITIYTVFHRDKGYQKENIARRF